MQSQTTTGGAPWWGGRSRSLNAASARGSRNAMLSTPTSKGSFGSAVSRQTAATHPSSHGGVLASLPYWPLPSFAPGSWTRCAIQGSGSPGSRRAKLYPRSPRLAGTFQGQLRPGLDAVRVDRMAGQSAIVVDPDGAMTMQAPSAFVGALGGYRFRPQGSGFRTNLFAHDVFRRLP